MKYFTQVKGAEKIEELTKERARFLLEGCYIKEAVDDVMDNNKGFRLQTMTIAVTQKGKPMSDLIERKQAIDAAIEAVDEWDGGFNFTRACIIKKALKALPPAHPEIIRCKDCRWRDDYGHWLGCPVLNTDDYNLRNDPDAEWVEIVRCKDCMYWVAHDKRCVYLNHGFAPNMWCCHAERRTDEADYRKEKNEIGKRLSAIYYITVHGFGKGQKTDLESMAKIIEHVHDIAFAVGGEKFSEIDIPAYTMRMGEMTERRTDEDD